MNLQNDSVFTSTSDGRTYWGKPQAIIKSGVISTITTTTTLTYDLTFPTPFMSTPHLTAIINIGNLNLLNVSSTGATLINSNLYPIQTVPIDNIGSIGSYNSATLVNITIPAISYYNIADGSLAYIRANDAKGATWRDQIIVDNITNVGLYTSICIVDTFPAISYYDQSNGNLKYVRAKDINGDTWDSPIVLDSDGDVGKFTSLKIVNGYPAIAYYDQTNGNLKYIRANDTTGTLWGTSIIIDSTDDVGQYTSLVVVDGYPAVSYYDLTNEKLKYIRATDPDGSSTWGSPLNPDISTSVGQYTSMIIVDSYPAISYYDAGNGYLNFIRASDITGDNWNPPIIIDTIGNVGQYTSIIIYNSKPAISYYDATNQNLKYVEATATDGSTWGTPINIDTADDVGQYTTMIGVNISETLAPFFAPAIIYYNKTLGDLKYTHIDRNSSTSISTSWDTASTLDNSASVGSYSSLAIINTIPAISYRDVTNTQLKYISASDISGSTWNTPVVVDTINNVGLYTSLAQVNSNPAIAYIDITNDNILYCRASNQIGTTWNTPIIIGTITGYDNSHISISLITLADGTPAISYTDNILGKIMYSYALDINGESWNSPIEVDNGSYYLSMILTDVGVPAIAYMYNDGINQSLKYMYADDSYGSGWNTLSIDFDPLTGGPGSIGLFVSLKIIASVPAISYQDYNNNQICYIFADDQYGSSWSTPSTIIDTITGINGSIYQSLADINGFPAVTYYDYISTSLKYSISLDNGYSWGTPVTIDDNGSVGQFNSLILINNQPGVSYYDATNTSLKFIKTSTKTTITYTYYQSSPINIIGNILTGDANGQYTSIKIINNFPAISYYDMNNQSLKYVIAFDSNGVNWGTPIFVDTINNVGQYTSLNIVNNYPAISYYDVTNMDLKYVRATDVSGSSWGSPVLPDPTVDGGQYTSLLVVNGKPAISYYDTTNGYLKYVQSLDNDGNTWKSALSIDTIGNVGQFTSMAIINSNPAISYYDVTNNHLKYIRAQDPDGDTWNTPLVVGDYGDQVGQYTSLSIVNGYPAISYFNITTGQLMFVRAGDQNGLTWLTPLVLDQVGQYSSISIIGGYPSISYYDQVNNSLKCIVANTIDGSQWNNPLSINSSNYGGQFTSLVSVNNRCAISYYDPLKTNLNYVLLGDIIVINYIAVQN